MTKLQFCDNSCILPNVSVRGQRGRVVWALDLEFGGPEVGFLTLLSLI